MKITLELHELKTLCADMAALGVATQEKLKAPAKDKISQRAAFRQYQEGRVRRWVAIGLITPQRNGAAKNSTRYYSRADLMAVNQAEKLNSIINR